MISRITEIIQYLFGVHLSQVDLIDHSTVLTRIEENLSWKLYIVTYSMFLSLCFAWNVTGRFVLQIGKLQQIEKWVASVSRTND